jgi:predicted nucleic acid-binding protein
VVETTPVTTLLDAGPLIAALNRDDQHHRWARDILARLGPPFHSCPEAMAEAAAMTGRPAAIVEMIHAGEIVLSFDLAEQAASVLALLNKYADRQMDLADACIVRMTELVRDCRVVTVDRADFAVYRRNGRGLILIIAPPLRRSR